MTMSLNRRMLILITMGFLLTGMSIQAVSGLFSTTTPIKIDSTSQFEPTIHLNSYNQTNEIRVFSTAALAAYATSGSGSAGDPFIVENYNITAANTNPPLYISGVPDYFVIRNNIIDGQNSSTISTTVPAVQIYASQHITLENNIIMNAKIGIYDLSSSNNIYRDQTFIHIQGLSSQTIKFYQTTNNIIEGLDFVNSADNGIYLADAVGTIIRNTTIHNGATGLEITRSGANFGQDNIVYNSTFMDTTSPGIRDWGYNNTFVNNTFLRNYEGINIFQGDSSIIENNTFIENTSGITFSSPSMIVNAPQIRFNTFENGTRGIYSLNADIQLAKVQNNTFIGNDYGVDWDLNSGSKNNFTYNQFQSNGYGMTFSGNTGVNASFNFILESTSIGISLTSAENTLILNNTIARSASSGLMVLGSIVVPSLIRYNDFIDNGGTTSQVNAYVPYTIDSNYYSDHSNIDLDHDGYADSSYSFDGGSYNDPTPLATFSVPYSNIDFRPPSITLSNGTYVYVEYGQDNTKLVWTAVDQNPNTYTIKIDGQQLVSHTAVSWSSGVSVVLNLTDFTLGKYNVIITFTDIAGNKATNMLILTIRDSTAPVITEDIITQASLILGKYSYLNWTAMDQLPSNYSLWIDSQVIVNHLNWDSGQQYNVDISSLTAGLHNITLQLRDQSGNSATRYYYFELTTESITTSTGSTGSTSGRTITNSTITATDPTNTTGASLPFSNLSVIIASILFIPLLLRSTIRHKKTTRFSKE